MKCHLCHEEICGDPQVSFRRVERRAGVSGRVTGYATIKQYRHTDCTKTKAAKAERLRVTQWALEASGVSLDESPEAQAAIRACQ